MTQPEVRQSNRQADVGRGDESERGRPVWALLGLLVAVSIAVFIMTLGFSAA